MFYERNLTVEMRVAKLVSNYATVDCHTIHTADGGFCECGDRKLRYLAKEYMLRKGASSAYEYADKFYYFSKGFQKFCGVWLREQIRKQNKKNERSAA